MFGYINADRRQLSDEDKQLYQQFYCRLRRQLGEVSGFKGQLLTNYDSCFLAMLLQSIYEPDIKSGKASKAIEYAADMNIILSYHSLMDKFLDEDSRFAKLIARLLTKDYKRMQVKYPRQTKAVEDYIHKLSMAEFSKEQNLDIVSSYTGEMLGELFSWKDDTWSKSLHCMGYYIGKFIYIIDAYCDLKKDRKFGNYNPLIYLENESPKEFETFVRVNLTSLMAECSRSFERLPITDNSAILNNIIYSGVWQRYQYLQDKIKK